MLGREGGRHPPRAYEGVEPTETDITLSWIDHGDVSRYELEYRPADAQPGAGAAVSAADEQDVWRSATDQLTRPCCCKTGLQPGVAYIFRVRGLRHDGAWGPFSAPSAPIRTRAASQPAGAAIAAKLERPAGANAPPLGERPQPATAVKLSAAAATPKRPRKREAGQPDAAAAAGQQRKKAHPHDAAKPARAAGGPMPAEPATPSARHFRLLEPLEPLPSARPYAPPAVAARAGGAQAGRVARASFNAAFIPKCGGEIRVGEAVVRAQRSCASAHARCPRRQRCRRRPS
jgi:hypothetical protein